MGIGSALAIYSDIQGQKAAKKESDAIEEFYHTSTEKILPQVTALRTAAQDEGQKRLKYLKGQGFSTKAIETRYGLDPKTGLSSAEAQAYMIGGKNPAGGESEYKDPARAAAKGMLSMTYAPGSENPEQDRYSTNAIKDLGTYSQQLSDSILKGGPAPANTDMMKTYASQYHGVDYSRFTGVMGNVGLTQSRAGETESTFEERKAPSTQAGALETMVPVDWKKTSVWDADPVWSNPTVDEGKLQEYAKLQYSPSEAVKTQMKANPSQADALLDSEYNKFVDSLRQQRLTQAAQWMKEKTQYYGGDQSSGGGGT
jgi:hypothetical protein